MGCRIVREKVLILKHGSEGSTSRKGLEGLRVQGRGSRVYRVYGIPGPPKYEE